MWPLDGSVTFEKRIYPFFSIQKTISRLLFQTLFTNHYFQSALQFENHICYITQLVVVDKNIRQNMIFREGGKKENSR